MFHDSNRYDGIKGIMEYLWHIPIVQNLHVNDVGKTSILDIAVYSNFLFFGDSNCLDSRAVGPSSLV